MGLLSRLFGKEVANDAMRLDILLDYSLRTGHGVAAVKWEHPSCTGESGEIVKAHLLSLFYGRILCVHDETRHELYRRINEVSKLNVRSEGATGFQFDEWILTVDGDRNYIWPWKLCDFGSMSRGHRFTAMLKTGRKSHLNPLGRWLNLDMALGLERVLCPASVLIAISDFAATCSQEARYFLALLLWQMNEYWGSADNIAVNTEARANAAAEAAIRSGQLRAPE